VQLFIRYSEADPQRRRYINTLHDISIALVQTTEESLDVHQSQEWSWRRWTSPFQTTPWRQRRM